ncbi:dTDP-4-dehydrorhamnose 3,5-epimerase [Flavobacteriaceae bacterium F89]|uniref:dTDP-4-dehydrorhamnose 3,5-epimerase n=1 Tax=Cerina litoralis TaxID=2874477 RepID=A0AAE3ESX4_9FLAO|nr:dTDP-4-dehydrorhamnose 3,5-epimerase [Cerina litoralis]MCG2459131.1 dTDP-4-dehydrorhamnose 3,5-epimerase [Cerina litoralis]
MKVIETDLKGCCLIEPTIFKDNRGVFFESYNHSKFEDALGQRVDFVQDNHSVSHKGVLRGLHFQTGKHAQAKLVRVAQGKALDVVVDFRANSATFGQHFKMILSESNAKLLFVPKGMAHGFLALEDNTVFLYKCDAYYHKESEGGIIYNDPELGIDWEYPLDQVLLSQKDLELPSFKSVLQ